ncbi:MAG: hypothetical protein ABSE93_11385 [Terriglobia bacterium]
MRCSCLTPLFLLALAAALSAQEPLITPETPIDSGTLHQWLYSGDPRLIAWAADFARRRHDAKILAEMPEFLVHTDNAAGLWRRRAASRTGRRHRRRSRRPHSGERSGPY